jgi:nucleoside-diphosphate-sugar epimerase
MPQSHPSVPRTILLLGGTGFIGFNLARELVTAGHDVLVGARTGDAAGTVHALPVEDAAAILDFVRDRGVEVVVHLVSTMKPGSSMADYLIERQQVVTPTIQLAHGLAQAGVALVFVSSGGTRTIAAPRSACTASPSSSWKPGSHSSAGPRVSAT